MWKVYPHTVAEFARIQLFARAEFWQILLHHQFVIDPSGRVYVVRGGPGLVNSTRSFKGFLSRVTPRPGRLFGRIFPSLNSTHSGRWGRSFPTRLNSISTGP